MTPSPARTASSAASSRSMASRRPPGRMRSRTSREWPPRPRVQSTKAVPGRGRRSSIDSCESTGTCNRAWRSSTPLDYPVGELVEPPHRVVGVGVPALLGPDLDPGPVADDGHRGRRLDAGQPPLLGAEAHPALAVELAGDRLGEQRAGERALLLAEQ